MSAYDLTDEQATWPRTDLLSPGTLTRPDHIRREDWARMGWHAKWKATRADIADHRPRHLAIARTALSCACGGEDLIAGICLTCGREVR